MKTNQTPVRVRPVAIRLQAAYRDFAHHNKKNAVHELVFILCSVMTDEGKYLDTYQRLRHAFPSARDLAHAPTRVIARVIARGGLSRRKARSIKAALQQIEARFGNVTLAPLRALEDAECERFLTSLPGVGKKVARCVMLYSFGRNVFPVDTHCWRIAKRLGWVRPTRRDATCSSRDMDRLQRKIPPELRFSLHVNFISLGRDVCHAGEPLCGRCPIETHCSRIGVQHARSADATESF